MPKYYNDITIPPLIRTDRIISAFENCIERDKLEKYTELMQQEMLSHDFPPIQGYPMIIDETDFGDYFLTGEEIDESHLGLLCWKVTDGHHRSLAAIAAELPHLAVTLDYSCITQKEQLTQ